MEERDSRRSKLYAAEHVLIPMETPIPSVKDVERYITKNSKRQALIRRYGTAVDAQRWKMVVKDGGGTRNALCYGTRTISIPLWARNDRVVLHEWAHAIHNRLEVTGYGVGGTRSRELAGGASHGWQFAAIYLDLVQFCMGPQAAAALKAAYKSKKVRIRAPRKRRSISPEQKQVLTERLARARAARKQD
jgi:putative metallohydrolase (TIGR04338 family)